MKAWDSPGMCGRSALGVGRRDVAARTDTITIASAGCAQERRRRRTDRLPIEGKRSLPLPYFRLCVRFCISAGGPKRCGNFPRRRAAKKAHLPNSAKVLDMMQSSPVNAFPTHQMTAEQLRYLGASEVVYLKLTRNDGEPAFIIYGADGTPLEMVDTIESAVTRVAENNLHFVAVH